MKLLRNMLLQRRHENYGDGKMMYLNILIKRKRGLQVSWIIFRFHLPEGVSGLMIYTFYSIAGHHDDNGKTASYFAVNFLFRIEQAEPRNSRNSVRDGNGPDEGYEPSVTEHTELNCFFHLPRNSWSHAGDAPNNFIYEPFQVPRYISHLINPGNYWDRLRFQPKISWWKMTLMENMSVSPPSMHPLWLKSILRIKTAQN